MITPRQALPRNWTASLLDGRIGIGHDVATTAKKTSNPSSITVTEHVGGLYRERLVLVYKADSDEVAMAMLQLVLDDIAAARRKARRMCVDASSEVFYAQAVRRKFIRYCPIELVKSGASIVRGTETFSYKVLLGNLYSGLYEDGLIATCGDKRFKDDIRRVHRERGSFETELGENGEHGECFDSGKLAYWALESGAGRAYAEAMAVGSVDSRESARQGVLGTLDSLFSEQPDHTLNL